MIWWSAAFHRHRHRYRDRDDGSRASNHEIRFLVSAARLPRSGLGSWLEAGMKLYSD